MLEGLTEVVLLLGGFQVVITALLAFAAKVWLNGIAEKQKGEVNAGLERLKTELGATNLKLQSALDKDLHVHKLQFEKEQRVYESIWSTLVEVQKGIVQLRPVVDHFDPEESEEERKRRRYTAAVEAYNPFLDQVNTERPFYAEEVYSQLQDLRRLMSKELTEYRILDPNSDFLKYWEGAEANAKAINDQIEVVCEAIRSRLRVISAA